MTGQEALREGDCCSGCERNQGYKDVIAGIDLKSGVGHVGGSSKADERTFCLSKGYRLWSDGWIAIGYHRGFAGNAIERMLI